MKYKSFLQWSCCNTYIIYGDNGDCAVIDPGYEGTDGFEAAANLDERLKLILLTHRHSDHLLAAVPLRDKTGAKIAIHKADAEGLKDPNASLFYYVSADMFASQKTGEPDILLNDGDIIDVGGSTLKVLHTPGHTAGGVCFIGDGVIFTGDTLFAGSMGRIDFPTADSDAMARSLTMLASLDGNLTICSGHGEVTTIEREVNTNPYIRMAKNGTFYD